MNVASKLELCVTLRGNVEVSSMLADLAVALEKDPGLLALRRLYDALDREYAHVLGHDPEPWKDNPAVVTAEPVSEPIESMDAARCSEILNRLDAISPWPEEMGTRPSCGCTACSRRALCMTALRFGRLTHDERVAGVESL